MADGAGTCGYFIVVHRLWFELPLLVGLAAILVHLVRRRRSKPLSVLVEAEFRKYKKKLVRRCTLSEWLSSPIVVITAFVLPVLISLVIGFLSFIFGKSINDQQAVQRLQDMQHFLSTLHACGTIVASFTAMLVTIIVFAVQINRAYVIKTSSLFKFYLKRLYFKPVLAFAAGTAGACLVNGILLNHFNWWPLAIVPVMIFLGYSVIALDLILLFKAIHALVRSAISELLKENYVAAHRDSLLADVKRRIAQSIYVDSLEGLGFLSNFLGIYERQECTEYTLSGPGLYVNNIYFGHLEKLARKLKLRPFERDKRIWEGGIGDNPPCIKIWPGEKLSEKEKNYSAMLLKEEKWDKNIQQAFRKSIDCGKRNKWGVSPVEWPEISDLLKSLVEGKDINGVKSVLEGFRTIVEDYLRSRQEIGWPHTNRTLDDMIMSPYLAPTLRNLDFHKFIQFAVKNDDEECIEEITNCLYLMADTAFEFDSPQYFDEVFVMLNWVYECSRSNERLAKSVAGIFIRRYKNIGDVFVGYVYKDKDNPDSYNHVYPFIEKYLKNILNALRSSAKYSDIQTFEELMKIANSLLKHQIGDDIRLRYWYNYEGENSSLLEVKIKISDVINLLNLVISAWLYLGAKEGEYDKEKVKPFIESAIIRIPEFHTLIETYLLARKDRHHESMLEYDWWDTVPGEVYSGDAFSRWIEPFWLIIALGRASSKPKVEIKRIRLFEGFREFDCQTLRPHVDSIMKTEDHKWLTGKDDIGKGAKFLLGVFGALAQRQRKIDYEKIVSGSVTELAMQNFKKNCAKAYNNNVRLRNLIAKHEKPSRKSNAERANPWREYLHYVDKEDLTGEGRDTELARIYGEDVGRWETLYYSGDIEERLIEKGYVQSFQELKAKIKNETAILREKGFKPQIVFIPWDHRYEKEMTDKPDWKRECPLEGGPFPRWVASMDGMEVFVWPHQDSECVGIIDISAFARFVEREDGQGESLKISFRNLNEKEMHQFLIGETRQRDRREFKKWLRTFEYDIRKAAEMKRIVVIEDKMVLELLECGAGVKLLPSEDTMGIVYKDGEQIYHLPECKVAQKIPATERRYFHTIGLAELKQKDGFHPCDECRPNYQK